MKRDFLKGLGIEDSSIIDKILDENGADLSRERSKFSDYESIKQRAETAENRLKEFEKVDVAKLTKERDTLKEQLKTATEDKEKEINGLKLDYEVRGALGKAGAKNAKAVRALLDTDKIKFEDGKLTGLDEQLEQLKKDNGFLFEDGNGGAPRFSKKASGGGSGEITKEAFAKMGYSDRIQLKNDNPELYNTLRKE